jgi:hypothetical protein
VYDDDAPDAASDFTSTPDLSLHRAKRRKRRYVPMGDIAGLARYERGRQLRRPYFLSRNHPTAPKEPYSSTEIRSETANSFTHFPDRQSAVSQSAPLPNPNYQPGIETGKRNQDGDFASSAIIALSRNFW